MFNHLFTKKQPFLFLFYAIPGRVMDRILPVLPIHRSVFPFAHIDLVSKRRKIYNPFVIKMNILYEYSTFFRNSTIIAFFMKIKCEFKSNTLSWTPIRSSKNRRIHPKVRSGNILGIPIFRSG